MKISKCANMAEFGSALRIYYNLDDVRVSDVHLHNSNAKDSYHMHNHITEILFIIDGSLEIKIKTEKGIETYTANRNKIVIFYPHESHAVKCIGRSARVIVMKYVKNTDKNLLNVFINDWESD